MRRIFFIVWFICLTHFLNAQSNGDYQSAASGNWNSTSTWQIFDGGWIAASSTPTSADGIITIRNTHTVTVTANVTIDQTVIESGGTLRVNTSIILTVADGANADLTVASGGTLRLLEDPFSNLGSTVNMQGQFVNSGTITINALKSALNFLSGSLYDHAQEGNVPIPLASWHSTSTCRISGVQIQSPGNITQSFGNFVWNCPGQLEPVDLALTSSTSIDGNFEVQNTNGQLTILSNSTNTIDITGDLVISGPSSLLVTAGGSVTLNIGGGVHNASSEIFYLSYLAEGTGTLNIIGNLSNTDPGVLYGNENSSINFTGNNTHDFTGGGSFSDVNVTVATGSTLNLDADHAFTFRNLTIENSAILNASSGNNNISGALTNNGTFNNDGGTITFNGTSSIVGTVPDFHNINITGTLTAPTTLNVAGNFNNTGTLTAPANLNLAGNFNNTGTFNHNDGMVIFNGSGVQNVEGEVTFYDISTANTSAVEIEGIVELERFLELGSGTSFDADGDSDGGEFILRSFSETHSAGILAIPDGVIFSGDVTFERFIAESNEYTYLAFPVNGLTVADLQASFPVTGTFTGATTGGILGNSPSLYRYQENVAGDLDQGWDNYPKTTNTEEISSLTGWASYMRDAHSNPDLISLRGDINQGLQNLGVSYTTSLGDEHDGWNLVVNPYPCAIDWNSSNGWTKENINAIAHIWNGANHYTSISTEWNGIIAPGQAFWVKANENGPPSLQCTEEVKIDDNNPTFFRKAKTEENTLIIALKNNTYSDKTYIYFKEDATDNFDSQYDAYKLSNSIFNLSSSVKDDLSLAVNSMPFSGCEKRILLKIDNINTGSYSLNFSNLDYFDVPAKFTLIDHFSDTETEVTEGSEYNFSVTSDLNSKGDARFELVFELVEIEKPQISVAENILTSNVTSGNQWYLNGEMVPEATSKSYEITETGIYSLIAAAYGCPSVSNDIIAFISDSDQNFEGCEETIGFSLNHIGVGDYTLVLKNLEVDENVFVPVFIDKYLSYETIIDSNFNYEFSVDGEEDSYLNRFEIQFMNEFQPEISIEAHRLTSDIESGNQWFKDDILIEGATENTYQVTESGTYHVEVTRNGCAVNSQKIAVNLQITGWDETQKNQVKLYPNPGTSYLSFEVSAHLEGNEFTVEFYDNLGKLTLRKELKALNGKNSIDIRNLNPGFYNIAIQTDDISLNYKFLKK